MALESNRAGVRADQVDTFGRVTSPSFLNELLDCLPEWTDMPVYKGGTEEILPSNTAVPTTSPIVADIKYPDGMCQNQVFTYRETPAEVDGLAKIKSIKGNTLVWNQLVQNGNFESTSGWSINSNGTLSVANNEASITLSSVPSSSYTPNLRQTTASGFVINHKYLFSFDVYLPHQSYMRVEFGGGGFGQNTDTQLSANTWQRVSIVKARDTAPTSNLLVFYPPYATGVWSANDVWKIRNVNVFDLTQMGLDSITDPSEFISLFPLPYYSYNSGSLLSFNGTGIKTTGKNLCPKLTSTTLRGVTFTTQDDGTVIANGTATGGDATVAIPLQNILSGNYYFSGSPDDGSNDKWNVYIWDATANARAKQWDKTTNVINSINSTTRYQVYIDQNRSYLYQLRVMNGKTANNLVFKPMITSPDVEFSYEPYTTSTTSLPTSTYFPTGMKSAGSVYDELTPRKAITRIGVVDLGTLNWSQRLIGTTPIGMQTNGLSATIKNPSTNNDIANIISTAGTASSWTIAIGGDSSSGLMAVSGGYLFIATTETNPTAFKSAMSGVYLFYELATPVELPTIELE